MKKALGIIVSFCLLLTLAACSTTGPDTASTAEPASASAADAGADSTAAPSTADDGSSEAASTGGASGETYKVGFVISDLNNDYFITLVEGIEAVQDQYGIEVIPNDGKSDATKQVDAFENFITQGVDAIVCAAYDSAALTGAVKQAQDAGIPVIAWSEELENWDGFLTLKQYDYGYTAGSIAGDWIVENLESDADAQVLVLTDRTIPSLSERGDGIIAGIQEKAPNAVIVDQLTGNTAADGIAAVENVLARNPDLNVIVSICDSAALGAYEAMVAAGKGAGDAAIVGCDAIEAAIEKVAEDTMYVGTVDIGTFQQGEKFCEVSTKVIKDGPMDEPLYVDFIPVTKANIADYAK